MSKTSVIIIVALLAMNISITLLLLKAQKKIRVKSEDLIELTFQRNEFRGYIQENFNSFKVPVDKVKSNIEEQTFIDYNQLNYVVFIPSGACQSCVSTFFSEIKTTNSVNYNNLYYVSEFDDQIAKRLWVSNRFDANKFIPDKYNIFKTAEFGNKVVLLKIYKEFERYDFLQYELFLDDLVNEFADGL